MSIYKNAQSSDTYWATWRTADFLPHCMSLMDRYFEKLDKYGLDKLREECYHAYYGTNSNHGHSSSKITFTGKDGKVVVIYANLFRNLLRHTLNTVTAMTPATVPVASNNEFGTKAQIISCKNVMEHYDHVLDMPSKYKKAVELYLLYGDSYIVQFWDEDNQELRCEAVSPRRVIYDLEAHHSPSWYMWAERISRFEAIAKYNVKEKDYDSITNVNVEYNGAIPGWYYDATDEYTNSFIDVYHFWHTRTPALPEGRYTIFVNDHISFTDHLHETMIFEHMPVHRFNPEEIVESPFGYSTSFDLLGTQKLINSTLSTIYNNQDKGKTVIAVPSGTGDPMPAEGDPNLTLIHYPADKQHSGIQKIDTLSIPEQLFRTYELMKQVGQQITGLNSTAMGESTAKSGSHAALLSAVTQQFQSSIISSYVRLIEETSTARISLIKNFLPGEIMLRIGGKNKRYYLDSFKREDISEIAGIVRAQGVSPLLSTPSGRLGVAQDVMKLPPEARRQFMRILDTGQLDDEFMQERDLDMTLSEEREALQNLDNITYTKLGDRNDPNSEVLRFDGTPDEYEVVNEVRALVTDNHSLHLKDHAATLSSPQVRNNPQLVRAVSTHAADHIWQWTYGNRQLLLASGQEPLPPPQMPQQAPKQPQRVPLNAVPNTSQQVKTQGPYSAENLPRLPNQPVNPTNPTVSGEVPGNAAM